MSDAIPAITGKQLIRLFRRDGWTETGRQTHGIAFTKRAPDGHIRTTIIPDKRSVLPDGTLAAILGPKQSGIGSASGTAVRPTIEQAGVRALMVAPPGQQGLFCHDGR